MRPNRLRQLLNEGKPSIGHHVTSTSPDVVEIIGRAGGVDYLEFVAEYMPYDLYSLDNFGRALELTGMSGMIKNRPGKQGLHGEPRHRVGDTEHPVLRHADGRGGDVVRARREG